MYDSSVAKLNGDAGSRQKRKANASLQVETEHALFILNKWKVGVAES